MGNMETVQQCASPEVAEEESAFLISVIRRFEGGVTEGHFHTLLYAGQKLARVSPRYHFGFQQLLPFSEDLDLKIALLLWNNVVCIRDNRIRAASPGPDGSAAGAPAEAEARSLDNLSGLSYDALKVLAAVLHMEQDLNKSRQEAVAMAVRLFPIQEAQALKLLQTCSV